MSPPIHIPSSSGVGTSADPTKPTSGAAVPFRELIPDPSHPRIAGIEHHNALSWCESRRKIDAPAWLINRLEKENLERPFVGFSNDEHFGRAYDYSQEAGAAPLGDLVPKVVELLRVLGNEEKRAVDCGDLKSDEFRLWSNPELYVNPGGLRLDECTEEVQTAVHAVLQASLSPQGYEKVMGCCLTNGFLGHLVNGRKVLNEHSYNFRLFSFPADAPETAGRSRPFGYTFFGHHLCLAVVFARGTMVIGPTFMGAEPDQIDEGPHAGLRLFKDEEHLSVQLMRSLSPELQRKATLSKSVDGKDLPEGRWNPFDERHLGGTRQDNRKLPYEGCPVSLFKEQQKDLIVKLFMAFNEYYPESVLNYRLATFKLYLDKTYFAWIGEFGDEDPFYYRIHSPVAFMELDFHCGIFLTNTTPARCHIHTTNRLPNGGDYGRALLHGYSQECTKR